MRWSQTGNYGTLPSNAMPNSFLVRKNDPKKNGGGSFHDHSGDLVEAAPGVHVRTVYTSSLDLAPRVGRQCTLQRSKRGRPGRPSHTNEQRTANSEQRTTKNEQRKTNNEQMNK